MTNYHWRVIQALIRIVLSMTGYLAMEPDKLNDCVDLLNGALNRDENGM